MIDDLKTQEKKVTAKYANHAKKEADWGFPSRIWRPVRLRSGQDFAVESLCLVSEAALGPLCPGGEGPCETKPIPAVRGGTRPGGTRNEGQNKPNCPKRGTEAVSRSRPGGGIPSIPLLYHSTIPIGCQSCETNPILGLRIEGRRVMAGSPGRPPYGLRPAEGKM
jgi:hypothetical protein